MKRLLLVPVLAAVFACGGATPSPAAVRAGSRAAVDVAKDAWVLVAHACIDAAQEMGDAGDGPALEGKCASYLSEAHDLIVAAAEAVDTDWSPKAACDLAQATVLVAGAANAVGAIKPQVKPIADDAVVLATAALGSSVCAATDGGAK